MIPLTALLLSLPRLSVWADDADSGFHPEGASHFHKQARKTPVDKGHVAHQDAGSGEHGDDDDHHPGAPTEGTVAHGHDQGDDGNEAGHHASNHSPGSGSPALGGQGDGKLANPPPAHGQAACASDDAGECVKAGFDPGSPRQGGDSDSHQWAGGGEKRDPSLPAASGHAPIFRNGQGEKPHAGDAHHLGGGF